MANTPNLGLRKIDSKSELFNQTLNYEANFDKVDAHAGAVIAQLGEIETKQGLLTGLLTTAKTSIVNAINELFNNKANKAQEAWITPTLSNGATAYAGSTPGYFKDQFGVVRLRGKIIVANDTFAIMLPASYRPPETISFVIAMLNNSVFARCQIDLNGGLKVYGTMSTYFDLGSIQFKAV